MKNLFLSSIIFLYSLTNYVFADTIHNNTICFLDYEVSGNNLIYHDLSIESFTVLGYSITESQELEANNIYISNLSDKEPCLVIPAGRKLSVTPKNWVQNKMGIRWSESNMITRSRGDTIPDQLNFALQFNIKFKSNNTTNFYCDKFFIGQGSDGAGLENWWLFSNNNKLNYSLTCAASNSKKVYMISMTPQTDEDNELFLGFSKAIEIR